MPRDKTIDDRICRLINLAFKNAKSGDEKTARSYWRSLVNSGYIEDGETKHEFEKAIKAGLREHGLVPPIMIRRRPESGSTKTNPDASTGSPKASPKPLK
jgi:hypothetical protein